MSVDRLAEYLVVLVCGITGIMSIGCLLLVCLREPILRQRCSELTILAVLLWILAAFLPLPRLVSLPGLLSANQFTLTHGMPLLNAENQAKKAQQPSEQQDSSGISNSTVTAKPESTTEPVNNSVKDERNVENAQATLPASSGSNRESYFTVSGITSLGLGVYLTSALLIVVWLVIGRAIVWWIVRRGYRLDSSCELAKSANLLSILPGRRCSHLAKRVRIVSSSRCGIPFAYGIFKPTIVLPSIDHHRIGDSAMIHALRHEWVHIVRGDAIGRAIMNVALPLLALHPLYWWLRSAASFASEVMADELAAGASSRANYSSELISIVRNQSLLHRFALGTSPIFTSRTEFYRRIQQLLHRTTAVRTRLGKIHRAFLGGVFLLLLALVVGIAGINRTVAQSEGPAPNSPYHGISFTDDWSINNVVSTSAETPAVAIVIPEQETVEVRGEILNTDGTPAAGTTVWAASIRSTAPHRERVQTDGDGKFTLHLRPMNGKDSKWRISAFKGNDSVSIDTQLDWFEDASSKQLNPLKAQLVTHDVLHCRLLALEDKQPIVNAKLYLHDGRVLVSDADGRIEIGGLNQGVHEFNILAAGRHRERVRVDNSLQQASSLNILLSKAMQIVGTVTDKESRPIPHASTNLYQTSETLELDGRCSLTDENGRFVWEGISENESVRAMFFNADGYEAQYTEVLPESGAEPVPVSIQLAIKQPPKEYKGTAGQAMQAYSSVPNSPQQLVKGALRGRVVDPDGKPISDFRVLVAGPNPKQFGDQVSPASFPTMKREGLSFSSQDGKFATSEGLWAGHVYSIKVQADGYGEASLDRVFATDATQTAPPEENLIKLATPNRVAIQVTGNDSDDLAKITPIANARATVIPDFTNLDWLQFTWRNHELGQPYVLTDADGKADISGLAIGEGTIAIQAKGYAVYRFGWREKESQFNIKLVPESIIAGTIELPTDSTMSGCYVQLWGSSGQDFGQEIDLSKSHEFRLDGLPADTYTVLLYGDQGEELYEGQYSVSTAEELVIAFKPTSTDAFKVQEKSRTQKKVPPGTVVTINGRDPNDMTFEQGLEYFKKYMKFGESKQLTSDQLRQAIKRAPNELKNFYPQDRQGEAIAALKQMADSPIWPRGAKLYSEDNKFATRPEESVIYRLYVPLAGLRSTSPQIHLKIEP